MNKLLSDKKIKNPKGIPINNAIEREMNNIRKVCPNAEYNSGKSSDNPEDLTCRYKKTNITYT